MKEIHTDNITRVVARLCIEANTCLPGRLRVALAEARKQETSELAGSVLDALAENADIAREENIPICQDTGMTVVFLAIGQDISIKGCSLEAAVNEGVRIGYQEGFLRKSIVLDPIKRENSRDNTPAVIHSRIVPGDSLEITVAPKGFGSENMSGLAMLKPSQGLGGIEDFVVETVKKAGANPCPPIVVGVGVGGTMEKATLMSKEALLREIGGLNPDPAWSKVENRLLERVNALNIGPAGFGGKTTALAVNILTYPTHIAGLPVAVNIGCHATRHKSAML
ncbi:MAG: fumarate hydratase [Oscillospiraceae bacterium]|nr:fumarate hydratase [Oscillospiraceae bacterium]